MLYYKFYIVYRDFITTLIIRVLSFAITHLAELLLVRCRNVCMNFVVILQDLHCLQIFYHKVDHWSINIPIVQNFTFSGVFISEI